MFQNNVIAGASGQGGGGFFPHEIDQSLRFNDNDSAYLSRTPSIAGNRKTWTWSGWVKRGHIGDRHHLFSGGDTVIRIESDDEIDFYRYSGGYTWRVKPSAKRRDPSAWYHIVVALDTPQLIASNRVKIWVNGELQTQFTSQSYPSQNSSWNINNTSFHEISDALSSQALDGYLAEVNFIDGQALNADSFGEFKSGVWVPKAYAGTYGTNGFHLDFGNSAAIGDDISGNNNDWTANNLAESDVVLDSPTNNFATLNPLAKGSSITLSEGNLKDESSQSAWRITRASMLIPQEGKWYAEFVVSTAPTYASCMGLLGTSESNLNRTIGDSSVGYIYYRDGNKFNNATGTAYGATQSTGDIIGIAFDADTGTLVFYKNGVSQGTAYTGLTGEYTFASMTYNTNNKVNFGQDSSFAGNKTAQGNTDANGIGDFYYSPPAGYLALCTTNLPEPAFSPANDESPQDHFNTVLYTGNGGTSQAITGVGFQSDFTWIKNRSEAHSHQLYDVVRGAGVGKSLKTNAADAEGTYDSQYGYVGSLDSDGFTVTKGSDIAYFVNKSSVPYVAWNWKANGSGVSNTDGSITSTVSANTQAGFSIVSFNVPTASDAHTAGHGLNQKPDIVIGKSRVSAYNWWTLTDIIDGSNDYLALNSTAAKADDTVTSGSTSTVIPAANAFWGTGEAIAYCFHSVPGFSKFGSYTGNGSTDGPFVYCGFRPAFVMFKRTDVGGSGYNWDIFDSTRNPSNVADEVLYPNLSNAEGSWSGSEGVDFLSNGFKLRVNDLSENASGGTYIFMAFAENPFKYSNAR